MCVKNPFFGGRGPRFDCTNRNHFPFALMGRFLQTNASGDKDTQKFEELIFLIPKFCKCLSTCSFKKALIIMTPIRLGTRADLSADENARSPFVILALAENMFADFSFVDIEIKRPSESLTHLYAQALVDLELLRQFFVLQIRTASVMGKWKGVKQVSLLTSVLIRLC